MITLNPQRSRAPLNHLMRLGDSKNPLALLLIIILIGTLVRLANLPQQGFVQWDEAGYTLEARYWLDGMQDLTRLVTGNADGALPWYSKPTHVALIALSLGLFGDTPFSAQYVQVFFGVLTIPLIFRLGQSLKQTRVGLIAAIFLALSPFHIMYSRIAFADADATFFFQAGLLIWILTRMKDAHVKVGLFTTGVLLGASATTNHRFWPIVLVSVTVIGLVILKRSDWNLNSSVASEVGFLFFGVLVTPVFWQFIFELLRIYAGDHNVPMRLSDYFTQLRFLVFAYQADRYPRDLQELVRLLDLGFYAKAIFMFGGLLFSLLVFSNLFWTLKSLVPSLIMRGSSISKDLLNRSGAEYLYIALGFAFPFLFFTFYPIKALRFMAVLLPTASYMAAGILLRAKGLMHGRRFIRILVACVFLAIMIESAIMDTGIINWRSGFQVAMAYLNSQGVKRVLTTQIPITGYYNFHLSQVRWVPGSEKVLYEDFQDGYEYFLVDELGYYSNFNAQLLRKIEDQLSPVFVAADTYKNDPAFFLEQDPTKKTFDEALAAVQRLRNDRGAPQIRIYRLTSSFVASLSKTDALPSPIGNELLQNPGFEDSESERPVGWLPYGHPIFDETGRQAHSGRAAVCTPRDGSSGGYTQWVSITPGTKYRLDEYVKADSLVDELARVQINWLDAKGSIVGVSLVVVTAPADAWRLRSMIAEAPPGSSTAIVYVSVHQEALVCFDDFSFAQVER